MAEKHHVMTEEEFFEDFEKPKVLTRIVGFAGLDPCRKDGGDAGGNGGTTEP